MPVFLGALSLSPRRNPCSQTLIIPLKCTQSKGSAGAAPADTLQNLQVFLTLQKAEEKGFSPDKYGLTPDQAADLAVIFTKYDINDDMVLEPSEVRKLL